MATLGRGPSSPINITAGGTLASNQVIISGSLVGVVIGDAASGAQAALAVEGVFDLPKEAGFAIGTGAPVYFDAETSNRAEDNPALPCIGYATEDAISAATTVRVRLVPSIQPTGATLNNLAAAARPAVTDDVTLGYTAGSTWVYQGVQWVCVDNADGAAKWRASNPLSATVTVASGAVTGTVALPTGAANGDHVQATNTTDLTNEEAITRAIATGGNVVIHMTGDPGVSTAVVTCKIWPADVG
jgi:predicted RecA/RadA family phage recombinase